MRKVSEILGKNIISLYEGKNIGIIENVAFDKKLKKLKSFVIYDEDNDNIDRLFVPSSGVKIEGENAVMIKNLEKVVEDAKNLYSKKNPMNADVYNLKGTLLGKVNEVLIAENTNDIYSLLLTDGTEILQTQIVSGDFKTIVIQGPGEPPPVLTSPKKKNPVLNKTAIEDLQSVVENHKIETDIEETLSTDIIENLGISKNVSSKMKVQPSVLNDNLNQDSAGLIKVSPINENINKSALNAEEIPANLRRYSAHFGFLIGRRVEYDVYNALYEKIVAQDTIITNNALDTCKKWGKLITLAKNSVR